MYDSASDRVAGFVLLGTVALCCVLLVDLLPYAAYLLPYKVLGGCGRPAAAVAV